MKVYPNPSSTDFSILINSSTDENITVKVMDISGNILSVKSAIVKGSLVRLGNELRPGVFTWQK